MTQKEINALSQVVAGIFAGYSVETLVAAMGEQARKYQATTACQEDGTDAKWREFRIALQKLLPIARQLDQGCGPYDHGEQS